MNSRVRRGTDWRAIVEKCAREGARVTFLDVDPEAAREAVRALAADGLAATFVQANVTREAEVASACATLVASEGAIDVLVNNAGINTYFDAAEMTEAEWDAVFAVDLKGAWLCTKHVLPAMRARRRGAIINIASIHATLTIAGMFPYAAAKSGLVGFISLLVPDMNSFSIVDEILAGNKVPWSHALNLLGYADVYVIVLLAVSIVIFDYREI